MRPRRLCYHPGMRPRLIVLDADGTVWLGSEAVPAAPSFIARARAAGLRCVLASNNAKPGRRDYLEKCRKLGLAFELADIFSVNHLAGPHLAKHYPGARTLVLGSEEFAAAVGEHLPAISAERWLAEHGIPSAHPGTSRMLDPADMEQMQAARFDLVLVGIDHAVNYLKLSFGCIAVEQGARLIGANQDPTYPVEHRIELPGNGSLVQLLALVTRAEPEYLGKPEPHMLRQIAAETGVPVAEMAVVGDRVETDIEMARRLGLPSFLVLTGVTAAADAPQGVPGMQVAPTLDDVAALLGIP